MKIISTLLIIGFSLTFFSQKVQGQEESITIENSTELIKESDFKQKRKYKYLDNELREEKTLIKFGLSPLSSFATAFGMSLASISGNLSYEQKVIPSLSIILNNNFDYQMNGRYYKGSGFSNDIGVRYYYSMNKEIKTGASKNNFNSNYFSIKLDEIISYKSSEYHSFGLNGYIGGYSDSTVWTYKPYINLSWGMQRRIGKWFYMDGGPYFKFNADSYGFGLNLQLGVGWGK